MGTGNAWAAAGMLRVLETIAHSDQAWDFRGQQADLTEWVHEIISAAWKHQVPISPSHSLNPSQSFIRCPSEMVYKVAGTRLN